MIKKFVEQVGNVSLPKGRGSKPHTSFNGVNFMGKGYQIRRKLLGNLLFGYR